MGGIHAHWRASPAVRSLDSQFNPAIQQGAPVGPIELAAAAGTAISSSAAPLTEAIIASVPIAEFSSM